MCGACGRRRACGVRRPASGVRVWHPACGVRCSMRDRAICGVQRAACGTSCGVDLCALVRCRPAFNVYLEVHVGTVDTGARRKKQRRFKHKEVTRLRRRSG